MSQWLADRGVTYIEQPLKEGNEAELPALFKATVLPSYLDESCRFRIKYHHGPRRCTRGQPQTHECGGITEALRIIATAKAFGLKTMIGCMSDPLWPLPLGLHSPGYSIISTSMRTTIFTPTRVEGFLQSGITMPDEQLGTALSLNTETHATII